MTAPKWKFLSGISTVSEECVGIEVGALSGGTGPASAVWPASNDAIFVPMYLNQAVLIQRLYVINGATASGNIDMGIYTEDGARITSIGSTAQSGTNVAQFFNITDLILGPGRYYLACAKDDTTGTVFRMNISILAMQKMGFAKMATAFALPATATFAAVTASYIPIVGAEIARIL